MRNITLFTAPKQFTGKFDLIQRNAIRSWLALDPTPEIVFCGKDAGIAEVATELGVVHVPNVRNSIGGTPLYSSVFREAQAVAKNPIVAYLNSDIVLTNVFLDTVDEVSSKLKKFMIVGRRTDVSVANYIDFSNPCWEDILRAKATKGGKLHPPSAMDYFVFEKGVGINMPPFVVGRIAWDNWFVAMALHHGFNVVDATERILAIHQEHASLGEYKVKETMLNCKLASLHRKFTTDSNWVFSDGKLVKTENFTMWKKISALRNTKCGICDAHGFPKFNPVRERIVVSIGSFGVEDVEKHLKLGYSVIAYTPRRDVYNDYLDIGNLRFAPYNLAVLADEVESENKISIRSVLEKLDEIDVLYIKSEGGEEIPMIMNNSVDLFLRCRKIVIEFSVSGQHVLKCLEKWKKAFTFLKLDDTPTYRCMRKIV